MKTRIFNMLVGLFVFWSIGYCYGSYDARGGDFPYMIFILFPLGLRTALVAVFSKDKK